MRSKASFKGHPIHPMLVSFPIAFFIGSFSFHALSIVISKEDLWMMGTYLSMAGICTALLAAIPGAVDYFLTIPPDSSADKRGAKHAIVNLSVVALFTTALIMDHNQYSKMILVSIESAAVILLTIGGWLGGTLTFRNQIGVDHRYAGAGKWKEEYIEVKSNQKVIVARLGELQVNQMKLVHINNKRIVVARTETEHAAFDDFCTHKGGSLAGGSMICGTVQCPWHGSQFDVCTGENKAGPASKKITTYPLKEEEGNVYLLSF